MNFKSKPGHSCPTDKLSLDGNMMGEVAAQSIAAFTIQKSAAIISAADSAGPAFL